MYMKRGHRPATSWHRHGATEGHVYTRIMMIRMSGHPPCCRPASVLPPWNSRCKIELIFGVMLQFNVVWCIRSRREIVFTIQSDNGKQGYKVGGKKYCRPKVVLFRQPWRPIWQRLDSETRGILTSQRGGIPCHAYRWRHKEGFPSSFTKRQATKSLQERSLPRDACQPLGYRPSVYRFTRMCWSLVIACRLPPACPPRVSVTGISLALIREMFKVSSNMTKSP